ncbi:protein kinase [Candidatus Uabimicrobium sp. HlEnr_7]|uniref:protein kinase domain-containing protein n=1 Tax=Candidatus Uabimicrobium helgolandensis TaxID=3095367 RepID=UPI003557EFD9
MIAQHEKNILQFLINKNVLTSVQVTEIVRNISTLRQAQRSVNLLAFLQQQNYISADVAYKLQQMISQSVDVSSTQVPQANAEQTMMAPPTQVPQANVEQTMMAPPTQVPQVNVEQTMMAPPTQVPQANVEQTMMAPPTQVPQANVEQTMMAPPTQVPQANVEQTMMAPPTQVPQANVEQTMMAPPTQVPQANVEQTMMTPPTQIRENFSHHVSKEITSYVEETAYPQSPAGSNHQIGNSQLGNAKSTTESFRISQFSDSALSQSDDKMFSHYRIERELGRGGMGLVLLAYDTKLDRRVALKVIINEENISEEQIRRFALEARATAKLKHPNIVEVYEAGNRPKNYFTMEYIKGKPFSGLIQKGSLKAKDIAVIMKKSADAIYYAYKEHKIIHRDIKPSNIMMDNKEPKIMDFGLAKEMDRDEQLSQDGGGMMGTLGYMPPEQVDNDNVGHHSDVYALGATLYNALTGRAPFQGESYYMVLRQIHNDDPIPPGQLTPGVPKELEAICLKCLQKKPQNRYKNAKAFADDLGNFLYNRPVIAKPPSLVTKSLKWVKRNKTKTSIVSIVALFLTVFFVLIAMNNTNLTKANSRLAEAKKNIEQQIDKVRKERANAIDQLAEAIKSKKSSLLKQYQLTIMAGQFTAETRKIDATKKYLRDFTFEEESFQSFLKTAIDDSNHEQILKKIISDKELYSIVKNKKFDERIQYRGWEWLWLKSLSNKDYGQFKHTNSITAFVHDKQGAQVVCGDSRGRIFSISLPVNSDSSITMWNRAHNKGEITQLAISPDRKYLISGCTDRQLFLWNLKERRAINKYLNQTIKGSSKPVKVSSCIFMKDSKHFVVGYEKRNKDTRFTMFNHANKEVVPRFANAIIFSVKNAKPRKKLFLYTNKKNGDGYDQSVTALDVSSDGKKIAIARNNANIFVVVVDVKSGKEHYLKGDSPATDVAFSTNGRYLVATNEKGLISIFNAKTLKQLNKIKTNTAEVVHCAIHPQSKILATAGKEHQIVLWNMRDFSKITTFKINKEKIKEIAFDSTGEKILFSSKDDTLTSVDLVSFTNPVKISDHNNFRYVHFHPQRNDLVFSSYGHEKIFLMQNLTESLTHRPSILAMGFSDFNNNGSKLALAVTDPVGSIGFVDFRNPKSFIGILNKVTSVVFRHEKVVRLEKEGYKMISCDFHPTQQRILVGQGFNSKTKPNNNASNPDVIYKKKYNLDDKYRLLLHLYSLKNKSPEKKWSAYFKDEIDKCYFSPDGKQILVVEDKKLHTKFISTIQGNIFSSKDFEHYTHRKKSESRDEIEILHACFSPDSNYIAVATLGGTYNLVILDAKSLQQIAILEDHTDNVNCCAFSPDGKRLVSCGGDKTVRIWNVEKIKQGEVRSSLLTLKKHTAEVAYCAFSGDGKNIASCGLNELLVWKTK